MVAAFKPFGSDRERQLSPLLRSGFPEWRQLPRFVAVAVGIVSPDSPPVCAAVRSP
jgi:hypothetical protein